MSSNARHIRQIRDEIPAIPKTYVAPNEDGKAESLGQAALNAAARPGG
jgi:hypothetical protein